MLGILRFRFLFILVVVFIGSSDLRGNNQDGFGVVINEIHYDPDIKTEHVEFIELYNAGTTDVDLAGWYFSDGISYQFPAGAIIPAGGYIILAQNPEHIQDKWGAKFSLAADLIYGPFEGKLDNSGERIELCNAEGEEIDRVDYKLGFPWPTVGDAVPENSRGTGHSIQLINPAIDNDLGGSWRSSSPTPAAYNILVHQDNPAPHIRQVNHSPPQPTSGEAVTITAKVTDADGIAFVMLNYQVVEPGAYINLNDWQYGINWYSIEMHDDGLNGDETAGDDIYTVQIPETVQIHRRLIRYLIAVEDTPGNGLTVPYSDDPQPNFAYFVYDGVPAWSGAIKPGDSGPLGEVVEYGTDVMCSLPVYHLLSKEQDVLNAQYLPGAQTGQYRGSDYLWFGTLVYDGEVYDHIRYRARGGVWRYAMGKNMWKFDFNRGHSFQARDDYGRKYNTKWDKLNFSACIQQGDYLHRGEQGIFEAAGFKLFNLVGVESPKTNWLHFRVIDDADEFGTNQYSGDFWGLYMTIEQMDGRFLNEHNLPDGNLYKIEGYNGELNNQGPTAVTDKSDLNTFLSQSNRSEQWWRENVSLERYYFYRCVVEGIHHGDIGYGKNYFFYLNPETNLWSMLPWDLDLTWAENMYGNGQELFINQGAIFSHSVLLLEYKNCLRQFQDLLYNTDQLSQLLDELADIIDPPTNGPTFVDADRAMWDYNPIMTSGYVNSGKAGQGRFYQRAGTKDFRGMVRLMKDYVVFASNNDRYWWGMSGPSMKELAADPLIPDTPIITATSPPEFPINALTFEVNPFTDPQGDDTFAAMKWRIAEVEPGSQIVQPQEPPDEDFVLIPNESQWRYFKGTEEPSQIQGAWRGIDFNDGDWLAGQTSIGYGDNDDNTLLNDMRNNYSSLYLRHTFTAANIGDIDMLKLSLSVDDGCIIWINGTEIGRFYVSGGYKTYSDFADNHEAIREQVTLSPPYDYLVEGENIVAVHVLNASLSSSDLSIDIGLTAGTNGGTGGPDFPSLDIPPHPGRPGRYEIDAIWETEELTDFDNSIQIPAGVVNIGRTYRVRCRMKDNTGRWSHWSVPIQFEAGEPISAGILDYLRITELMYNPADSTVDESIDNDEFEFIELKNTGDQVLDLTDVSFVDGIAFDFKNSDFTRLEPGEFVLVVKNKAAFESRYGVGLAEKIAGEYTGSLSNSGEKVSLVDFWNGTIAEFEYSDGPDWPVLADGAGHSLVPLTSALPDEPDGSLQYPENWRASTYIGGSPGEDDPDN